MSPLAIELLRRHQASPNNLFYGDARNSGELIDQPGFAALDAAYGELVQAGYVTTSGTVVSHRGTPKPNYRITEQGRAAQPVQP